MKKPWHKKWTPFGLLGLEAIRTQMRKENLYDTEQLPKTPGAEAERLEPIDPQRDVRTADGSYTDAQDPNMGRAGGRMGRNVPLDRCYPDAPDKLMKPNPRTVSRKLLTRDEFVPATSLNILAAAWIQFMQHGWFSHFEDHRHRPEGYKFKKSGIQIPLEDGDRWPAADPAPEEGAFETGPPADAFRPMRVVKTPPDHSRPPGTEDAAPPSYVNVISHWWDASQIYGSNELTQRCVRSHTDGKLRIGDDRTFHYNPNTNHPDIPVIGFIDNFWIGLGILYKIFILEHNAICDRLKQEYPDWDDEQLFQRARLIVAALLAKIHTIEWTPGLLGTEVLDIAMKGNWFGLVNERRPFYRFLLVWGARLKRIFFTSKRDDMDEALHGILKTEPNHHAAPFSMTEEFNAMYRLHGLIRDEYEFRSARTGEVIAEKILPDISGALAREFMDGTDLADLAYTFGILHPGALRLHNYPRYLQNLRRDNGDRLDLATIDVLRDRERGIPRYNEFRELIGMKRVKSFEELTDNPQWAEELREVYEDDLESVDLMVGMYAEPLLPGFAISEVAFRIFILMASRRLKSDRFFTTDYRPEVYTQVGLDWIDKSDFRTVILRHMPELEPSVNKANAFAPWTPVGG